MSEKRDFFQIPLPAILDESEEKSNLLKTLSSRGAPSRYVPFAEYWPIDFQMKLRKFELWKIIKMLKSPVYMCTLSHIVHAGIHQTLNFFNLWLNTFLPITSCLNDLCSCMIVYLCGWIYLCARAVSWTELWSAVKQTVLVSYKEALQALFLCHFELRKYMQVGPAFRQLAQWSLYIAILCRRCGFACKPTL